MHPNQIALNVDQVRRIVNEQFPQWRGLSIEEVGGSGTVNRIFRFGARLSARFPLVVDDPDDVLDYLQREAEAAREISGRTKFATPEPVAFGRASPDYPAPWAVHTWLPGKAVADADFSGSKGLVRDVAQLIIDVRAIPVRGRSFRGHGRGGDLRLHDDWMETCLTESDGLLDVGRLRSLWSQMRGLPRVDADVMTHGDILPSNLLVDDDALVGVLDVGNLGPADPALDLMGAWSLFDHERRQLLRHDLECSDLEWARGQAWAFQQAMGTVWYYRESNPVMSRLGRRALEAVLQDLPGG